MIDVTDEMIYTVSLYRSKANSMLDKELCDKIIELHEQSKPKPEPVAYMAVVDDGSTVKLCRDEIIAELWSVPYQPLYTTTPPTREPLSEQAIDQVRDAVIVEIGGWISWFQFAAIVKAIEKAHGIGVEE